MSTLYYVVGGSENEIFNVRQTAPLQHVSVTGLIRDAVAQYTLEQTYVNPRKDAAIEASYTFPLYEGVAVSGFEAVVDGRTIVGKVQEKVAARKEYDEAVKAGKVASLLEQERPDIFQASVGNIPPSKTICIRITLVSEIKQDADENQVRFVLPTTIAPRYGAYSSPVSDPTVIKSDSATSKLMVNMSCAMSKSITSIQSPSHTIEVHLGTTSSGPSSSPISFESNRARVSLTGDELLDRDLVIIVQSVGLDSPRALVERHSTDKTHAISLTFSPRFALSPLRSSELIFLVDRSGSMSGSPISQAGQALELFLRSIPFEDHYFNVIGFGSTHKTLFPKSTDYNAESLKTSVAYAKALDADMGGTEITSVFQDVFQRRRLDVPTQIFLLTDGEVWDVDALAQCIREAVAEGEKNDSFVRVFSLGIGSSVSHHLIESVARVGGGYAQLVVEGERMEKKVVNMLKSALIPPVTNVGVQWSEVVGVDLVDDDDEGFEIVEASGDSPTVNTDEENANKTPINLFSTSPEVVSPPPPILPPDVVIPINQAPFKIPALYRGARFTIYAILSPTIPVPKELILRGSSPDGPVELKVNIESVHEGETMLHSLAARSLVRDLEEGASCIHALGRNATDTSEQMLKRLGIQVLKEGKKFKDPPLSSHLVSQIAKQKILDIALRYNLSSKYTSWVAIDQDSHQAIIHDNLNTPDGIVGQGMAHWAAAPVALCRGLATMPKRSAHCPPKPVPVACAMDSPPADSAPQAQAESLVSSMSMQEEVESIADTFECRKLAVDGPEEIEFESSSPGVSAPQSDDLDTTPGDLEPNLSTSTDPHTKLRAILQHQEFDGLFPLIPELASLLGTTLEDLNRKLGELRVQFAALQLSEAEWEAVWATCVAVEFLKKGLADLQEEWELVVEKAGKRVTTLVKNAHDVDAIKLAATELA